MDEEKSKRCRIFLACTPRSGSTSLLKCLSFVDSEVEVWFEPFVIARFARLEFQKHTGKELPTEWTPECDLDFEQAAEYVHAVNQLPRQAGKNYAYSEIKRAIENTRNPKVVVKDTGGSFPGIPQYLPSPSSGYRYIFVIRDPYHVVPSYKRASFTTWKILDPRRLKGKDFGDFDLLRDDPYYRSVGSRGAFLNLHAVWTYVRENLPEHGTDPLVIDYADLMADPEPFLRKICEIGGFEYRDGLLEWDQSPDVVASWKNPGGVPRMLATSLGSFHKTAINSACFMARKVEGKGRPSRDSLDEEVLRAIDEGIDYYNEMYAHRYIPK